MENDKFLKVVGEFFGVHEHNDCVELETWTNGGVNMFITINKGLDKTYFEQFEDYVLNFDMEEEVDVHREDKRYRNAFPIKESVNDFESYERWLQSISSKLNNKERM